MMERMKALCRIFFCTKEDRIMEKKKIVFIVGSLRKGSFNRQMAEYAAKQLKNKAEVEFLEYREIPYMDQDIEYPAPEEIKRVREHVFAADGLWIFSPEYNGGIPGVLKNLLDWLSRPLKPQPAPLETALLGKKIAISAVAGKSAGAGVLGQLQALLTLVQAKVMEAPQAGLVLLPQAFETGVFSLGNKDQAILEMQAEAFLRFLDEE